MSFSNNMHPQSDPCGCFFSFLFKHLQQLECSVCLKCVVATCLFITQTKNKLPPPPHINLPLGFHTVMASTEVWSHLPGSPIWVHWLILSIESLIQNHKKKRERERESESAARLAVGKAPIMLLHTCSVRPPFTIIVTFMMHLKTQDKHQLSL